MDEFVAIDTLTAKLGKSTKYPKEHDKTVTCTALSASISTLVAHKCLCLVPDAALTEKAQT